MLARTSLHVLLSRVVRDPVVGWSCSMGRFVKIRAEAGMACGYSMIAAGEKGVGTGTPDSCKPACAHGPPDLPL